jgi:predicted deacylase
MNLTRTRLTYPLIEMSLERCDKTARPISVVGRAASAKKILRDCEKSAKKLGFEVRRLGGGLLGLVKRNGPKWLSIASGMHGEERSGPYFLRDLLRDWATGKRPMPEFSLAIVPIVNIDGWNRGDRVPKHGHNVNGSFYERGAATESRAVRAFWETLPPPTVFWDIHEDDCRNHDYVWIFGRRDQDPFNAGLADHMKCKLKREFRDGTASTAYMRRRGVKHASTTEVPPPWPFSKRVAWEKRAYGFIERWLTDLKEK